MSILINIGTILTGILLIGIIIYLMVEKKISESQSVLWILIGFAAIILGMFPSIINFIAEKLGVWYPPTISFLIAYVLLIFIVLRTTVLTSIQDNKINELFMEMILLKDENEKLKKELKYMQEGRGFY